MAKISILLSGSLGSSGAHNRPFSKFRPSSSGLVERAIEYLDLTQPPDPPSSGPRSRAPSHRPPWWRLHRLSFPQRCCPHPISPSSPPQHRWHRSGNALAMRTGATVRAAPSGSQTFKAKVNISLSAAMSRLNKTREERDQFDEASNQIVVHLKTKEEELSRSVASCKVESNIGHTWINFLEDAWVLQSKYTELKEQQTKDELEKCGICFVKLTKYHLSAFRDF